MGFSFNDLLSKILSIMRYFLLTAKKIGGRYESVVTQTMCQVNSPIYSQVLVLSFAAFLSAIAIYTFIYFLGIIFSRKEFKVFAKVEIVELIVLFAIIIFLIDAVIFLMCQPISGLYNMFDLSVIFINELFVYLSSSLFSLQTFYNLLSIFGNANTIVSKAAASVAAKPFEGLFSVIQPIFFNSALALVVGISLLVLLQFVLEYMVFFFIKYLIPVGIILRAFPITRRLGGALIGLSIGMIIFLPVMLTIGHYLFASSSLIYYDTTSNKYVYDPNDFSDISSFTSTNNIIDAINGSTNLDELSNISNPNSPEYKNSGEYNKKKGGSLLIFIVDVLAFFLKSIEKLMNQVCWGVFFVTIYPIIMTIVITTGVKYTSALLGQELNVSNLTRLI